LPKIDFVQDKHIKITHQVITDTTVTTVTMSINANSVSMETVNDSNTTVFGCMNKIQNALKDHDVYELNYHYLMNSPMMLKLKLTNTKLRNKNREYKMIIKELTSKLDNTTKKRKSYEEVKIKIEPNTQLKTRNLNISQKEIIDLVSDDEDEVIVLENNTKPNIVYEIIDEDPETDVRGTVVSVDEAVNEVEASENNTDDEEVVVVKMEEPIKEKIEEIEEEEEVEEEEESDDESKEEDIPAKAVVVEEEEEGSDDESKEEDIPAKAVVVEEEEEGSDDEEVFEITIRDKKYYTTNETDGVIYSITEDNDIGDKVGVFKNKIPVFLVEKYPEADVRSTVASGDEVEAFNTILKASASSAVTDTSSNIEEIETEEEVFEVIIKGTKYYTSNETDGAIYSITDDGEIGDEVGNFVKGEAVMKKI
jgi:hypothetical protein